MTQQLIIKFVGFPSSQSSQMKWKT